MLAAAQSHGCRCRTSCGDSRRATPWRPFRRPRRVEDQVEPEISVETVDRGHEAVLVGVVELERHDKALPLQLGLLEPTGVADDNGAPTLLVQLGQILASDEIVCAARVLDLVEQLVPARHAILPRYLPMAASSRSRSPFPTQPFPSAPC